MTWSFEPGVVYPMVATTVAYTIGVTRLWRAAGTGHGVRRREALAFAGAIVALVAALVSPLDALSDTLFSAHMVQHELLILVAAPLAAVSAPLVALLWFLPPRARRAVARVAGVGPVAAAWAIVTAPATAWLLHAAALWVWHLPVLFDAALANDRVHALQHLSFFGTAVLFWWGIVHGRYGRVGYGAGFVYVFTTALHSGVLGALLTVAPRPWYPSYAGGSAAWGLTPLQDQQLAGLIMWVPASVIFAAVGLALLASWIRESERRVRSAGVLSVVALAALAIVASACDLDAYRDAVQLTGGDPAKGEAAIVQYGCDTCHVIPGVHTARGVVGPPLTGIAGRVYLAGELPNTPANMERWIRAPRAVEPHTVMPDLGVTESDGRNIAAYLYTLR